MEIERLQQPNFAGGPVLIPVCKDDVQDEETRYMSATIVRDWRKREEGGVSTWYRRSRMVARDFKAQDPTRSGLYSPATSPNVQRAILLVAVETGLPIYVIDVKDAFLNVPQPGKVIVTAPQQLSGYEGCMWQLNRLLPGQREGTSEWSKLATKLLQESGMEVYDPCPVLFRGAIELKSVRVQIHVDDLLMCGLPEEVDLLLQLFGVEVDIKVQGPFVEPGDEFSYLRKKFSFTDEGLVVKADPRHFHDLVEQAEVLGKVRERKTPAPGDILEKDNSEEVSGEKQKAYRSIVGKLLYIYPEVPFCQWVINRLAQKMSKPTVKMVKAAVHFVGFLTTVQDVGLLLLYKPCASSILANGGEPAEGAVMQIFTDADWASDKQSRQSMSSVMVFCGRGLMYSYVRQQRAIALSSCESEYYAMTSGLSEGLLLHDLMQYLLNMELKLEVRTDSSSARQVGERLGVSKTRHLSTRALWLQKAVADKKCVLRPVPTELNPADLNTKLLSQSRMKGLACLIGIQHGGGIPYGADELEEIRSILQRRRAMKDVFRVIVQSEASVRRLEHEHAVVVGSNMKEKLMFALLMELSGKAIAAELDDASSEIIHVYLQYAWNLLWQMWIPHVICAFMIFFGLRSLQRGNEGCAKREPCNIEIAEEDEAAYLAYLDDDTWARQLQEEGINPFTSESLSPATPDASGSDAE